MTEEEWLATDSTAVMFGYSIPDLPVYTRGARGLSRRLASLFVAGCVRATPEAAGRPFLPRDVAGNPFRGGRGRRIKKPTKAHPFPVLRESWVTFTVRDIARGMYESRDFSGMPILADALQDAGCEDAIILDHRRAENTPHVRG